MKWKDELGYEAVDKGGRDGGGFVVLLAMVWVSAHSHIVIAYSHI